MEQRFMERILLLVWDNNRSHEGRKTREGKEGPRPLTWTDMFIERGN